MTVPVKVVETMTEQVSRTLVVGLGETGLSVARYLAGQGATMTIVDSRENPPGLARLRDALPLDTALFLGGFHAGAFECTDQIVLSPGISREEPAIAAAIERGVPVIGDIELFARAAKAPVIAVTGSNGKSTVTALLHAMAQLDGKDVRTGGNIGTPALDLLGEPEPDLYLLELSSFQLETTYSLRPAAAVVLNISADHMDRYRDLDDYAAAKQRVYAQAAVQVVNRDDPVAAALAGTANPVTGFGAGVPGADDFGVVQQNGEDWLARGNEALMPVATMAMTGRHNVLNALAALALGDAAGLSTPAMVAALREFQGLPHRMQLVTKRNGVCWYNDSKGTNVGATQAAIAGVTGKVVLIAGGDCKGADLSPLAVSLAGKGRAAVLLGKDADYLNQVLSSVVPVSMARDMEEAVQLAAGLSRPGDNVLLSPACASTDMYRNFQERGAVFVKAVMGLGR